MKFILKLFLCGAKEGSNFILLLMDILFLNLFLIGVSLLYNIVLVSLVQCRDSAICIHMSPPSWVFLSPLCILPLYITPVHLDELLLFVLHLVMYIHQCYSLSSYHPFQHHLLKGLSFPHCVFFCIFIDCQLILYAQVYFGVLYFVSLTICLPLCLYHTFLITIAL